MQLFFPNINRHPVVIVTNQFKQMDFMVMILIFRNVKLFASDVYKNILDKSLLCFFDEGANSLVLKLDFFRGEISDERFDNFLKMGVFEFGFRTYFFHRRISDLIAVIYIIFSHSHLFLSSF